MRQEEEQLKPVKAHQQAGVEWQKAWQQILSCCRDCMGLEHIAPEMKRQSLEFTDLPDVVGAIAQLWQQRWQQLSQATA